jgi:hypothetical protein
MMCGWLERKEEMEEEEEEDENEELMSVIGEIQGADVIVGACVPRGQKVPNRYLLATNQHAAAAIQNKGEKRSKYSPLDAKSSKLPFCI